MARVYTNSFVIVPLSFGGARVDCTFKVSDITGEPGKTCHVFNYGIHLAQDYVDGLQTADLFAALHSRHHHEHS